MAVDPYYFQTSQTEPGAGGFAYDMAPGTAPATTSVVSDGAKDDIYADVMWWTYTIDASEAASMGHYDSSEAGSPAGNFPFSVDVASLNGDVSYRFKIERQLSDGTITHESFWTSTDSTVGVKTYERDLLTSGGSFTWAAGDRVVLVVSAARASGHGGVDMSINTGADSWVDFVLARDVDLESDPIDVGIEAGADLPNWGVWSSWEEETAGVPAIEEFTSLSASATVSSVDALASSDELSVSITASTSVEDGRAMHDLDLEVVAVVSVTISESVLERGMVSASASTSSTDVLSAVDDTGLAATSSTSVQDAVSSSDELAVLVTASTSSDDDVRSPIHYEEHLSLLASVTVSSEDEIGEFEIPETPTPPMRGRRRSRVASFQ